MAVYNRGNMGLRIIVFMGAATFLFLALMAFGLKKSLQPPVGKRVPQGESASPFNENRAWADVEALLERDFQGTNSRQDYVVRALRMAGLSLHGFDIKETNPKDAPATVINVGAIEGSRPGVIVFCAAMNPHPAGSDAGAADAAWLLEMARVLGGRREGRSIWLVFFDGDVEPNQVSNPINSQAGTQWVEKLRSSQELNTLDAVVTLRGIGDCALAVQKDAGAPPVLAEIIWNTAERKGYGEYFGKLPARARDDHQIFREAGIPALALVDESAAGGDHNAFDQTDSASQEVCRESLRAVGDVIYHALAPFEGHLDETGMRIDGQ